MGIARRSALLAACLILMIWGASLSPMPLSAGCGQDEAFNKLSAKLAKAKSEYDVVGSPSPTPRILDQDVAYDSLKNEVELARKEYLDAEFNSAITRLKRVLPKIKALEQGQKGGLEAEASFFLAVSLLGKNNSGEAESYFLNMFQADPDFRPNPKYLNKKVNDHLERSRQKWTGQTGQDPWSETKAISTGTGEITAPESPESIQIRLTQLKDQIIKGDNLEQALKALKAEELSVLRQTGSMKSRLLANLYDLYGQAYTGLMELDQAVEAYQKMFLHDPEYARSSAEFNSEPRRRILLPFAERTANDQQIDFVVTITAEPADSEVALGQEPPRKAGQSWTLKAPWFSAVLRAPGYKTLPVIELIQTPDSKYHYKLEQDGLEYQFSSSPQGANLIIDGKTFEKVTPCSAFLMFGIRGLRIQMEGYAPWIKDFEVKKENDNRLIETVLIPNRYTPLGKLEEKPPKNDRLVATAISRSGKIWLLSLGKNRLRRFTKEYGPEKKIGEDESLFLGIQKPADIAIDSKDMPYVIDQLKNSVFVFDIYAKSILAKWGGLGNQPGKFNKPSGIAIDKEGRTYIADKLNHRIQIFGPDHRIITTWGKSGPGPADMNLPIDLAISSKNEVFVIGKFYVKVYSAEGQFLRGWGKEGSEPEAFGSLVGICLDDQDCVYLVDQANKRIVKYDDSGRYVGVIADPSSGITNPLHVAVDQRGRVYIANANVNNILIFAGPSEKNTP